MGLVWIFFLLPLIIYWMSTITFLNRGIVYNLVQVVLRIVYWLHFGFLNHWYCMTCLKHSLCFKVSTVFFPHIFNFRFSHFRNKILFKFFNNLLVIGIWRLNSFLLKLIILHCWNINFNLNSLYTIKINRFFSDETASWKNKKLPECNFHLVEYFFTLALLVIYNQIGQIKVDINFVHAVIYKQLKSFLFFGPDSEHFKASVLRCKVHL